jgi:hypothetical protein
MPAFGAKARPAKAIANAISLGRKPNVPCASSAASPRFERAFTA